MLTTKNSDLCTSSFQGRKTLMLHCDKIRPTTFPYPIIIDVLFAADNELDKMVAAVVVDKCMYVCCVCVYVFDNRERLPPLEAIDSGPAIGICLFKFCIFASSFRTSHISYGTCSQVNATAFMQKNGEEERHWVLPLEQDISSES